MCTSEQARRKKTVKVQTGTAKSSWIRPSVAPGGDPGKWSLSTGSSAGRLSELAQCTVRLP